MPRKLHVGICFPSRTYNVQVKFLPNQRMSCLTKCDVPNKSWGERLKPGGKGVSHPEPTQMEVQAVRRTRGDMSWEAVIVKEIFALEHVFMGNLKGQRIGKATGKIKLQIAEAACLCPEEVQSSALITVGSWGKEESWKSHPHPTHPAMLCDILSEGTLLCAFFGPLGMLSTLWRVLKQGGQRWGQAFWPLLSSLKIQAAPSSQFLEPLALDFGLLLDNLGESGTAHRSHWPVGPRSCPSDIHPPTPLGKWQPKSRECLGNCCPLAVS